jgi:hypothetical protein
VKKTLNKSFFRKNFAFVLAKTDTPLNRTGHPSMNQKLIADR